MRGEWSKEIFARNLKYYMEKAGKNQKEMAEVANVSAPTFNAWIQGKVYPRIDKIEILAAFFHCKKSDLIEEHVTREQHDTNSEIVEVIFKLRTSPELLKLCTILKDLDKEQITSITAMIQQLYGKNQ